MHKKSLQIHQLNSKMLVVASINKITPPPTGWLKAVRTVLGMSLQQLGNKLSITKQSVAHLESRERDGTITIKTLREAANALDMELVHGFVAKDDSLDALNEKIYKQPVFSWGAINTTTEGNTRTAYLKAVKTADKGDCSLLLAFARS
ncbi:MAG: helix-turn-helix domain-containing protein [Cryomorphaceae bacterium]|nr:helix-turn-helix domain-containing protein [Cryomorphaceae bacterium]